MININIKQINKFLIIISSLLLLSGCQSGTYTGEIDTTSTSLRESNLFSGNMFSTDFRLDIAKGEVYFLKANSENNIYLLKRNIRFISSDIGAMSEFEIILYEGGTDIGTNPKLDTYNMNRVYTDNSTFNIFPKAEGVDLSNSQYLPFGLFYASNLDTDYFDSDDIGYILKNNTDYYLLINNTGSSDLTLNLFWQWIE